MSKINPVILITLLVGLFLIPRQVFSEANDSASFNKNDILVSFGYGFPNLDKLVFIDYLYQANSNSTFAPKGFGPIHFRAEYGVSEKIGIGLSLNYGTYGATWQDNFSNSDGLGNTTTGIYSFDKHITSFTALLRFNYHVYTTNKLDPYFSFGGGYKKISKTYVSDGPDYVNQYYEEYSYADDGASLLPIAFEAVAGMRYYFTPQIAIYSELGIAKTFLQGGVSMKF